MPININWENVPARIKELPITTPGQREAINEQLALGRQNYNPNIVEPYARQQYFGNTVPQLAEMFTRIPGGQRSSTFAGMLGGSGQTLEGQLAGQRYQAGLNQLKLGLTPQFEYLYEPEKAGLKESLGTSLATSAAENLPGIIQKGGEYLWNKMTGQGAEQGTPNQTAKDIAGTALGTGVVKTGEKAAAALTPAQQAAQAGTGTATGLTAQQAAQQAVTGTGASEVAKQSAADAVKPGYINTAAAVAKYGVYGAAIAVIAKGLYEVISEELAMRKFPNEAPYPANFQEMSGPERSQTQLARQITTPGGQLTEADIIMMERAAGITPKGGESLQDRYNAVLAKKGR